MNKNFLNLDKLSVEDRNFLMEKYSFALDENLTGKERSEKTEARIRKALNIDRPSTTEYDFLFNNVKLELKQAEATGKQPKFQQVKPALYDIIICMLNYEDRSEWYILRTSQISQFSGKDNVEKGKLPLNIQHKGNKEEGQISPNASFYKFAFKIGDYSPLEYDKEDLNLSDKTIQEIFNQISSIIDIYYQFRND